MNPVDFMIKTVDEGMLNSAKKGIKNMGDNAKNYASDIYSKHPTAVTYGAIGAVGMAAVNVFMPGNK